MSYLILHMAKIKASEEEFSILYDQSGLNPQFKKHMFEAVYPYIMEIREMLAKENQKDQIRFAEMEWRLSVITSCRARQKIMVPKYTLKLDFEKEAGAVNDLKNNTVSKEDIESVIIDSDYNNLKRFQNEIEDALKSINGRYSKKVFKFLKW